LRGLAKSSPAICRMTENPNRARDHLANERTFLAWLRTGVATIVFGFAVGRFSIALQEILQFEGKPAAPTPGLTAWLGMVAIIAGVLAILAGHMRYHQTLAQIERGTFEPPRFAIDVSALLLAAFGLVLAGYLAWIKLHG
jgi:putative membrane protein